MPYDDIRFSWWDDPDDDEGQDEFFYADEYGDIEMFDSYYEPPYESECNMCGKERSLNSEGYCSQCWQVWNS